MKDKFELFNNIKINTEDYKEIQFSNNDEFKKKMKDKIKYNHSENNKKVAVIGTGILLGGMIVMAEPSLAYIQSIGKQIEYFFNREDNELSVYKVNVNKVVEDKGIKIELKEIMIDDGELLLSMNIDDSKLDRSYLGVQDIEEVGNLGFNLGVPKVEIGDMVFKETGGGGSQHRVGRYSTEMLLKCDLDELDKEDKYFDLISNLDRSKDYDVKIEIDNVAYTIDSNTNLPEEMPNYIEVTEINGGGSSDTGEYHETRQIYVNGSWKFQATINAKEIVDNVKTYKVNEEFNIKYKDLDIDVLVEEIRVSPTKIKIKRKFKVNSDNTVSKDDYTRFLMFIVKDEKGNEININDLISVYSDEDLKNRTPYIESELNREIKEIKVIPAIDDWDNRTKITKFKDKAFTLELDVK